MKNKKQVLIRNFAAIQMLFLFYAGFSFSLNIGDSFPSFSIPNPLKPYECDYLGIECGKDFSLKNLQQNVIVVEFFNVHCFTCRMQVEVFNDLFLSIKKDPTLSEKVRILGIAVRNYSEEVAEFKENLGVLYPILPDPQKVIFKMTRDFQGIPHAYILRKDEKCFIIDYHAGGAFSKDKYLSSIKIALRDKLSGVRQWNKVQGYSFISGGKSFDEKSFEGKKVILYFPIDKINPLAIDIRNTENQIGVLYKIKNKYPGINIVVFKYPGFLAELLKKFQPSSFYTVEQGDGKAVKTFGSPDEPTIYYINEFGRIAFKGDSITLSSVHNIIIGSEYIPVPDISEEDIINLIEEHIEKLGIKVISTEKVTMENRNLVYITTTFPRRGGIFLFSRLESKPSLCDVCHDSHFIYIIDQEGTIKDFIPVKLTKLENTLWSEDDIKKTKKSIVGKSILGKFPFNPKVDAVTAATMTTSLVFEALSEGKDVFGEFKDYNFRRKFWEQICFKNICKIKQAIRQKKKAPGFKGRDDKVTHNLLSEIEMPECPLQGEYIVPAVEILPEVDILCSVHGYNSQGC